MKNTRGKLALILATVVMLLALALGPVASGLATEVTAPQLAVIGSYAIDGGGSGGS